MTNLVTDIESTAEASPETTAIGFRGQELSYEAFWTRAGRFAQALADAGVEPGDRVGVYLPNLPAYVTAFHGILRAGGIVVPMNPQYRSREIEHLLGDSGAVAVVTLADLVPQVQSVDAETDVHTVVSVDGEADGAVELEAFLADETLDVVERADDDVACQPYTSGTTGTPKGVLLTHGNLAFEARTSPRIHDGIHADDRVLGVLPLFHIYGMTVTMLATLYEGGSYWPMPEWDAGEALELVDSVGITIVHGVPAMFNDAVNHPDAEAYALETVRFANAGGSSLPLEVARQFEELFEPELFEGYGLTETAPVTHANRPDDRRMGSIGKPLPGVESKVVDHDFRELDPVPEGPVDSEGRSGASPSNGEGRSEANPSNDETELDDVVGEIVVSGPNVMKAYYERPDANEEVFTREDDQRWFHTGDLGYYDEDGFFYIVDREKHMIVTGGYNVYPREVEELLFEHPDVADAAVVGVPDERRGETVTAFVVRQPDATVDEETVKQYCLDNLAAYKHPRQVEFVEELPRTTTGKVQKFELEDFE